MLLTGIRLEDIRVFSGDNVIAVNPGLTVLIGRNNAGKSTAIRAPFLLVRHDPSDSPYRFFQRNGTTSSAIGLQFDIDPRALESVLGFAHQRVGDIHIKEHADAIGKGLTELPEFSDWKTASKVELGYRWDKDAGSRTLRILSRGPDFVEVAWGMAPRSSIRGKQAQVGLDKTWFATALNHVLVADTQKLSPGILAHWEHHRAKATSDWIRQSTRRVVDVEEERLQEVLTFLRMLHPEQFDHISRALHRALPEFTLEFIDVEGTGFGYRPGFVSAGSAGSPLARESIGSGAWTYLSILTAARAAKVTDARVLLLDEPHLYMHPGLERLLLEELLEPEFWGGKPLQIIAATHSPTFVNMAVERGTLNILDWDDAERTKVRVRTVSGENEAARVFDSFALQPSDVLYADRLVFVEGPSDVAALRILARDRCKLRAQIRFVPLRETDAVGPEVARYFSIIVQAHGTGLHTTALLVLDGDKRATLEAAWDKCDATRDPRKAPGLKVEWSDKRGNDLESVFCDEGFLVAYFNDLGVDEAKSRPVIADKIGRLLFPAKQTANKGCTAIRAMCEELLAAQDPGLTKADDLERLMRFYVSRGEQPFAAEVRRRLVSLEARLKELGDHETSAGTS